MCLDVKQMRLNAESLVAKRWIVPNVRYPRVEAFFPLHPHGIDPCLWHNRINRANIGGGKAQLRTTSKTLHHGTFDGIIASQHTRRVFDLALQQEATDV